jgi:hypothetical protein
MTRPIAKASPTAILRRVSSSDRTGQVPTSASSFAARRARLRDPAVPVVSVERVALVALAVLVVPAAPAGLRVEPPSGPVAVVEMASPESTAANK